MDKCVDTKYTWDQELNEISIQMPIPEHFDAKCVVVEVIGKNILINNGQEVVVDGELLHEVDASSVWWIAEGSMINVGLSKRRNEWWNSLLVGSEEVDVEDLAENRHADIDMLDPEAREVVEKMIYNSKGDQK